MRQRCLGLHLGTASYVCSNTQPHQLDVSLLVEVVKVVIGVSPASCRPGTSRESGFKPGPSRDLRNFYHLLTPTT